MDPIKVEVVSPVHNRREDTLRFLKSLDRADKRGLDVHVIIVDDGSTDGSSEAIQTQFPGVQIVKGDGSLWYTAGMNRGFTEALKRDPDYILGVNNDSIFDAVCLLALVDCAQRYPRSVVGAILLNWETPHKVFQVAPKWELWRGGYRHWRKQTVFTLPEAPWEVELIVGNCVLFPAEAIREVGLMDEKRLVQFGDAEYTPRMRRAGWRLLIEPKARIFCKPNDEISGFRSLPIKTKFKKIFSDRTGPYSVHRRLYSSLGGAPSKLQGLLAVPIFYLRVVLGMSQEGPWADSLDEAPLRETYRGSVIND